MAGTHVIHAATAERHRERGTKRKKATWICLKMMRSEARYSWKDCFPFFTNFFLMGEGSFFHVAAAFLALRHPFLQEVLTFFIPFLSRRTISLACTFISSNSPIGSVEEQPWIPLATAELSRRGRREDDAKTIYRRKLGMYSSLASLRSRGSC